MSEKNFHSFHKKQIVTTQIHSLSIPDMLKEAKPMVSGLLLKRYLHLRNKLVKIEKRLSEIMEECPERTSCYLRYAPWNLDYKAALPLTANAKVVDDKLVYEGIEEWQVVLAGFYAEEATKLLRDREQILKKLYAIASRFYRATGEVASLTWLYPHIRKPWFKHNGGSTDE